MFKGGSSKESSLTRKEGKEAAEKITRKSSSSSFGTLFRRSASREKTQLSITSTASTEKVPQVEETLEVSQMFAKVYEYYHKVFGKDMVDVMMASKRIEVQLISRPQKEAILESCKELAAKYKQVKNILARGSLFDDIREENLPNQLLKFDAAANNLVQTVQNTSISATSFQEYVPTVQTLKKSVFGLKSFLTSPRDQQQQQYKLIAKTMELEEKLPSKPNQASAPPAFPNSFATPIGTPSGSVNSLKEALAMPNGSSYSETEPSSKYTQSKLVATPSFEVQKELNAMEAKAKEDNTEPAPSRYLSNSKSASVSALPSSASKNEPHVSPITKSVSTKNIDSTLEDLQAHAPSKKASKEKERDRTLESLTGAPNTGTAKKNSFLTLSPRSRRRSEVVSLQMSSATVSKGTGPSLLSSPIAPRILSSTDLFDAARKNNVDDAKELRKKGMGINGVDKDGWSALHHAASKGNWEMCVYLVSEGVNVDIKDMQGMTALERALLNNHEKVSTYLTSRGSKFDMFSKTGMAVMDKSSLPKAFWEQLLGTKLVREGEETPEVKPETKPLQQTKTESVEESFEAPTLSPQSSSTSVGSERDSKRIPQVTDLESADLTDIKPLSETAKPRPRSQTTVAPVFRSPTPPANIYSTSSFNTPQTPPTTTTQVAPSEDRFRRIAAIGLQPIRPPLNAETQSQPVTPIRTPADTPTTESAPSSPVPTYKPPVSANLARSPSKPSPTPAPAPDPSQTVQPDIPQVTVKKPTTGWDQVYSDNKRISTQKHLDEFMNAVIGIITILAATPSVDSITKEDLESLNDPLVAMTAAFKMLLTDLRSSGVILKPLHEAVVQIVTVVKKLLEEEENNITGVSVQKQQIVDSSQKLLLNFIGLYAHSVETPPTQDDILKYAHNYLLSFKQLISMGQTSSEPIINKGALHLIQLFQSALRVNVPNETYGNTSCNSVNLSCTVIAKNTLKLMQLTSEQETLELTKPTMNQVRELVSLFQAMPIQPNSGGGTLRNIGSASRSFNFETAIKDTTNVLESTISKLESKWIGPLQTILGSILEHSNQISCFVASTAHKMMNLVLDIGINLSSTEEALAELGKTSKAAQEDEAIQQLVLSLIQLSRMINIHLKMSLAIPVVKHLGNKLVILHTESVANALKLLAFYDSLLLGLIPIIWKDLTTQNNNVNKQTASIAATPSGEPIPVFMRQQSVHGESVTVEKEVISSARSTVVESEESIALHQVTKQANRNGFEVQAKGAAQLFEFSGKWNPTEIVGIVLLLSNPSTGQLMFEISDEKSGDILYQFEIPSDFVYHESSYYFHRFKTETGFNAFNFGSPEEAKVFHTAVTSALALRG